MELLRLTSLAARIDLYRLDSTEYACLKALAVFKPGIIKLSHTCRYSFLIVLPEHLAVLFIEPEACWSGRGQKLCEELIITVDAQNGCTF